MSSFDKLVDAIKPKHSVASIKKNTTKKALKKFQPVVYALVDADPKCKHQIVAASGGGVKCTKCGGWFCY